MKRILILSAILLAILFFGFGVVTGYSIPSPSASAPLHLSGSSPEGALEMICDWESLPPASDVWYRIPHSGSPELDTRPFLIRLVSYSEQLKGLEFQIYAAKPDGQEDALTISGPIGHSRVSGTYTAEWIGTRVDGTTHYVKVINNNHFTASYGLCDPSRRGNLLLEWQW